MLNKLKITSWNINGLKSLPQPLKDELDRLSSDIICFQETKTSQDSLMYEHAVVEGYEAYFNFCKIRQGYSGVCIYCKEGLRPIKADTSLVGLIKSLNPSLKTDLDIRTRLKVTVDELESLENEGRAIFCEFLINDCECGNVNPHHSLYVINVYCPMAEPENIPRQQYKTMFNNLLQLSVEAIFLHGSHVALVGDLNIKHKSMDIAEFIPDEIFLTSYHRHWLDCLLVESQRCPKLLPLRPASLEVFGKLVDSFRHLHPSLPDQYSCWNTKIGARITNFGTRIDFILYDSDLVGDLEGRICEATILDHIKGSDHCPVSSSIARLIITPADHLPEICTINLPKFRKQTRITSFFLRGDKCSKSSKDAPPSPPSKKQRLSVTNAPSNQGQLVHQWKALLKGPPKVPKCPGHKCPCVQRTVLKEGPNKGRTFWACSKPDGLPNNPKSRCNFFSWTSQP